MRLLLSFGGALLVALGLFALMVILVMPPRDDTMAEEELARVSFVRAVSDTASESQQRQQRQAPERPQPPEPMPQASPAASQPQSAPEVRLEISIPTLPTSIQLSSAPTLAGLTAAEAPLVQNPASASVPAASAASAPSSPSLSEEVTPLVDIPPNYPRRAVAAGIEGQVTLAFTITADGRVENLRVVDASPAGVFEREARRAVSRWRFKPRRENGRPVAQEVTKTLQFQLEERR
ncbi:energy transducer TonB [uncultured Halopseudomonas sp.]|uniref:energy transducer TonB n=1 Tax=uncultured Halopseudomonas sp. TaxID=2901193 RepID=UPI0030EC5718|tara:strand:+ start:13008 stop:13712 length:705 start_codon:yes stop_codon:yes gene_type:complete